MAITQTLCSSFKQELLQALHDFDVVGGNTFKIALYTDAAVLNASTTVYSTVGEVAASGSYTAGGGTLTKVGTSVSGTIGYTSFSDISFTASTITAFGALVCNASNGNRAVAVLNFGSEKVSVNNTFTIRFPPNNVSSAIIRII
jgi:hypothetical protein